MRGSIRRRGKNSWGLKFDLEPIDGRRRTVFLSVKGSRRDAEKRLSEELAKVNAGTFVEPAKTTVADFTMARIAAWRAGDKISERTRTRYDEVARHQIIPHLGATAIQRLSIEGIEAWHNELKAQGLSPYTIRQAHNVLNKVLTDGERIGKLARNICRLEKAPPVKKKAPEIVKDPVPFLDAIKHAPRFYALASLALLAGLRLGECLALRVCSADLDAGVLDVKESLDEHANAKSPKTESGIRKLVMPPALIETMRAHRLALMEFRMKVGVGKLGNDDYLFVDRRGRPLRVRTVSRTLRA